MQINLTQNHFFLNKLIQHFIRKTYKSNLLRHKDNNEYFKFFHLLLKV